MARFKLGEWERDEMCVSVRDAEFIFSTMNIDKLAKAFATKNEAELLKNLLTKSAEWLAMVRIVFPEVTVDEYMEFDIDEVAEFLVQLQLYCVGCLTGIEHPNKNSRPVKKKKTVTG